MCVFVGVDVTVDVDVGVDVGVAVPVSVGVPVAVGVGVSGGVPVAVGVEVSVAVGVAVLVAVGVCVFVGVGVNVRVGVGVGVFVLVGVGVNVRVGVGVGVTVGTPAAAAAENSDVLPDASVDVAVIHWPETEAMLSDHAPAPSAIAVPSYLRPSALAALDVSEYTSTVHPAHAVPCGAPGPTTVGGASPALAPFAMSMPNAPLEKIALPRIVLFSAVPPMASARTP